MTVTREIDGKTVEIDLTGEELQNAYWYQQHEFDRTDMEDYLAEYEDCPEDFEKQYGQQYSDAVENLDDLARRLQSFMSDCAMTWENARNEAIEDWAKDWL